jgi:hypothetical protein
MFLTAEKVLVFPLAGMFPVRGSRQAEVTAENI